MYTMNMNKQTLTERFEDYTEDTKQEEIWSDKIIGEEELQKKECHYDILNKASSIQSFLMNSTNSFALYTT